MTGRRMMVIVLGVCIGSLMLLSGCDDIVHGPDSYKGSWALAGHDTTFYMDGYDEVSYYDDNNSGTKGKYTSSGPDITIVMVWPDGEHTTWDGVRDGADINGWWVQSWNQHGGPFTMTYVPEVEPTPTPTPDPKPNPGSCKFVGKGSPPTDSFDRNNNATDKYYKWYYGSNWRNCK